LRGLALFRNFDEHGNRIPRPPTLLIDSEQLESGEALERTSVRRISASHKCSHLVGNEPAIARRITVKAINDLARRLYTERFDANKNNAVF
jgi:hypothetical protein